MYDTDEEQVEALKSWWMENGNYIISAILIAVVGYFGTNYYTSTQLAKKEAASSVYQELVELTTESEQLDIDMKNAAASVVNTLKQEHTDSTYAVYGALYSAKLAVENGDLDSAAAELNWALDQKIDASLTQLMQLRLARVEFARGNATAALKLLENKSGDQLVGFEEVRGDILLAQGDIEGARTAYQKAFDALIASGMQRPLLEMKLNDLANN